MLQPKKTKYRKQFRGKMRGMSSRGSRLDFGDFGLRAIERGWISNRQIESARKAISHHLKRTGRIWIRVFPDKPVTKKPDETGMGSGKGEVSQWVAVVKPGRLMFEIGGVDESLAKKALSLAAQKLSIKTKFVSRNEK